MDEWKIIPSRPNYEICRDGTVRRAVAGWCAPVGTVIKPRLSTPGYPIVTLWDKRTPRNYYIHRLLAEAFLPRAADQTQVNHLNGVKADNRLQNLEWCSPSRNIRHAIGSGLFRGPPPVRRGERAYHVKLTEEKVRRIRALRSKGVVWRVIANEMNISMSGAQSALKHWKHVI
jgi:hypothetical protein